MIYLLRQISLKSTKTRTISSQKVGKKTVIQLAETQNKT